ncbi:MAG: hypothetical protein LBL79_07370 [Prevotella sp.]|jgi:hypothetical protein|nr:hypothetical protein [Prevotella sp.]
MKSIKITERETAKINYMSRLSDKDYNLYFTYNLMVPEIFGSENRLKTLGFAINVGI